MRNLVGGLFLAIILASSALAQAPSPTDAALAAHVASLQAIIAKADSGSVAALITQRAAAQAQVLALTKEIETAEGPDVQIARKTLQALTLPNPTMPWWKAKK
jgi:hypothetical protein